MGRGSSGINKGSGSRAKLAKSLKLVEDRIRGNSTESAIAMDANGNILFDTSDGQETEVTITPEQMKLARGQILTHNHPNGYYFSNEDLATMEALSLQQLRATTPDGHAFVLERTAEMSDIRSLRMNYGNYRASTAKEVALAAWDETLSRQQYIHKASIAHTRILNEWLKENAPRYGYTFREE